MPTITSIDRDELRREIESGTAVVLEALPPESFEKEHLPGSRNVPLDDLDRLAPTLIPDPHSPVVVYCSNHACSNSQVAAERLAALGYTDVRKYGGGKQDWIEAGLPVESGPVTG